jgi:hypothetical protein
LCRHRYRAHARLYPRTRYHQSRTQRDTRPCNHICRISSAREGLSLSRQAGKVGVRRRSQCPPLSIHSRRRRRVKATLYVPDHMWEDREDFPQLFAKQNNNSFICGSASKLAKSTEETCKMNWLGCYEGNSEADAQAWVESVKEDRYVTDVFK